MLNVLVWHEYTQDVCTLHHCFCIIDHAIAPSHAPDSILRCFEQFINIMHFYLVESLLHFCPNSVIHWVQIWTVGRPSHRCGEMKAGVFRSRRLIDWWAGRAGTLTWKYIAIRPKGKKVWSLDTCYSATYMSQTRDQQRFTISEVAADWHEPMVPQRHPLPALTDNWTHAWCS